MHKRIRLRTKFICGLCPIFFGATVFSLTAISATPAVASDPGNEVIEVSGASPDVINGPAESNEGLVQVEETNNSNDGKQYSNKDSNQLVEVQQRYTGLDPYLVRRGERGLWIGFDYTDLLFKKYRSVIDDSPIMDAFKDPEIPITAIEIGFKQNWGLLSTILIGSYGVGTLSSPGKVTPKRNLELAKSEIGAKILLDGISSKQWAAPYVGVSTYRFGISEEQVTSEDSLSDDTQFGMKYNVGILIPLSGLDPDSAAVAYNESGLQNTYLDLYMTKFTASNAKGDPDMSTDFVVGAGIKLEF